MHRCIIILNKEQQMFKLLFKWRKIKKAIKEVREAYKYVSEFLQVAESTVKDRQLLRLLKKAQVEVIEAKEELRKLIK